MEAASGYYRPVANKTLSRKVCAFSYKIEEKQRPEDPSDFHCGNIDQLGKKVKGNKTKSCST